MKEFLAIIAENTIMIIHAMPLMIISIGTTQAFLLSLRTIFTPPPNGNPFHYVFLQYARCLPGWRADIPACRGHHRIIVGDEMGLG